jgi:lactate dehydrogenase-like 2-hydroxyacid dehydrogenase
MTDLAGMPRIIVTRRLPEAVESDLTTRLRAELNPADRQFSEEELAAALREADIVLCTLTDSLTRSVFEAARPVRARLLANFGVGFDHIDLDAAREAGIAVTNTPGVLTEDTADLTILLILAVARRAAEGERELRGGRWTGWRPTHLLGTRVAGKTLGLVGLGRIGRAVAQRARAGFGMRILYHSRTRAAGDVEAAVGAEWCDSTDELVSRADFVSLHTPATPDTHHLIDAGRLARFSRHAFLINTSRGDVIDEAALVNALDRGTIAGAALDVFEREPAVHSGLLGRENVVLIPHLGSATVESRVAMGRCAVANIDAFIANQPLPDRVA